jgi:PAS domain S-box-containing protein
VRDLLAAIVDSSDDAIVSKTLDGRVTSWNAGATRLFGYTAEEIIGQTYLPSDLQEEETEILRRLRNGERIARYETVRYSKSGRRINVSLSAAPLRDHLGRIIGAAKVARDITESKEAEAALKRSEEALRESDRRKDEFLSVLAHELRNPLAPLSNALELIRRFAAQDPELQRTRDMMERQLTQLVRIVDDLLDVSRISRGRLELRRAPVSLALAVESALESCQSLFYTRGHEIALDIAAEPLLVDGDFARLAQVFVNLFSNSAKYTDRGGRIRVSLERQGDQAVVTVRDSGVGIPRESLGSVFDMFSQIQSHKPLAEGGLGIGLALVRSLVQMHGGSVDADSEGPGTGSVFTVRLPLIKMASAREPGVQQTPAPEAGMERKRRILVADDNTDAASSLAMLLQMQGHETCTATDGQQAVELAATFQPDIIFMDVGMPRVDGLEATRQIRAQPWGKSMLIVALTGWGQQSDRRQTKQVGMDLHLVKPINLEGIAAVLAHS